jgi:hypothetical protein
MHSTPVFKTILKRYEAQTLPYFAKKSCLFCKHFSLFFQTLVFLLCSLIDFDKHSILTRQTLAYFAMHFRLFCQTL